jgi:prepilin-type N-terminal cleavage/methylation domain-containing protein/prepilin-type processing-associated H-X9-DG protein
MDAPQRFASVQRLGFTIIELLVVIAIAGTLMAITLPAIQKAREAVNRVKCRNHLKQIGTALHAHHNDIGYFPTGGYDWWSMPTYVGGTPTIGAQQEAGWAFQILPYIEANDVWRSGAVAAVGTPIRIYFCPSRRTPQTLTVTVPGYNGGSPTTTALCDYAASNRECIGAIQQFLPNRIADITDGTASTLLVSEKRLNVALLGTIQNDDDLGYASGFDNDTIRQTGFAPAPDYSAPSGDGEWKFGSSHPGRFNALFADGSVRTIAYSVDPNIFKSIGDKKDSQAIELDDL